MSNKYITPVNNDGYYTVYTEEELINIIWEVVNEIETSYNIEEVTKEFIKNNFIKKQTKDED